MDDATRAELADLRRRAYGPASDIADDPDAIDRLTELEALVHVEHPVMVGAIAGGWSGLTPLETDPVGETPDDGIRSFSSDGMPAREADAGAGGVRSGVGRSGTARSGVGRSGTGARGTAATRRARTVTVAILAAVAIGAVTAVALGNVPKDPPVVRAEAAREAYSLTRDPDAVILHRIPLAGSFDSYLQLPDGETPQMPSSGPLRWAVPLGEFYGWDLWIAGASGAMQAEQCLLVQLDSDAKARCVPATLREQSALVLTLSYDELPASERPPDMTRDERIGFWWFDDRTITVLQGARIDQP